MIAGGKRIKTVVAVVIVRARTVAYAPILPNNMISTPVNTTRLSTPSVRR